MGIFYEEIINNIYKDIFKKMVIDVVFIIVKGGDNYMVVLIV